MAKEQKASKTIDPALGFGSESTKDSGRAGTKDPSQMPFGTINYIGMVVSILTIFIGFWVMAVDHTFIDATQFSMALHVSPVIIILGYAMLVVAIMLKPGRKASEE